VGHWPGSEIGTQRRGEVGHIVQPSRCVGGHVSVGQNGSDTHRCGAADGGHVCVCGQPYWCVGGGHVCDCGQPYCCVGGGQMNVRVGATVHGPDGHGCTETGHPIVCGGQ
jgi:hypothetical protein